MKNVLLFEFMHIFFCSLFLFHFFFLIWMASFQFRLWFIFIKLKMLNGIQWPMLWLQCYDYDDNNDDDDANRTTSQLHIAVLQSVCDTMLVFCGLIFLSCVDKTRCQELFKYYVGFNGAFCFFSPFFVVVVVPSSDFALLLAFIAPRIFAQALHFKHQLNVYLSSIFKTVKV